MSIPAFLVPSTVSASAVDISKYKTIAGTEEGDKLVPWMQKLSDLTERLSEVVDSRLKESETDFLLAFQTHMETVNGDLDTLRRRADLSEAEQRREERVDVLKREVEWFKSECVRLNNTVKTKSRDNKRLIEKLTALQEDRKFLKNLVQKSARQVVPPHTAPPTEVTAPTQLQLQQPAIVERNLLEKAETLVNKEAAIHTQLDKEIARTKHKLMNIHNCPERHEGELLSVFENLVQTKERLTRTDKIELIRRLLSDEKVLNELLNRHTTK
jgi:hypothetical protein